MRDYNHMLVAEQDKHTKTHDSIEQGNHKNHRGKLSETNDERGKHIGTDHVMYDTAQTSIG